MLNSIKVACKRMRTAREINSLNQQILDDLGISREGLRKLLFTPTIVMRRLTAMATRHHVSQPYLSSDLQLLSTLAASCSTCSLARACAEFLGDNRAIREQAAFCPNYAMLSELSTAEPQPNRYLSGTK